MTRALTIEDLSLIATPSETAISPDGERVVYVRSSIKEGTPHSELWIAGVGVSPRRLSSGPGDSSPHWSPDGSELLFLRKQGSTAQLFTMASNGGEAQQLTTADSLPLGAGAGVYSPDGLRIAFAAPVQRAEHAGKGAAPLVTDRLGYKVDGGGWLGDIRVHLFVVERESGTLTRLSDGDWNAATPIFSPDGLELAYTSDQEPGAELTLSRSAYSIRLDVPGDKPRRLGTAAGVQALAFWRADGTAVVAVGSAQMQAGDADVLVLSTENTADHLLTEELDRSVMVGAPGYPGGLPALAGGPDGEEILFCLRDRGWTHLYAIPANGGAARPLVDGANQVVSALSQATGARRASFVLTSQGSFGEVAVVDLDTREVSVLTSLTEQTLEDVEIFAAEEREFEISDGVRVHGWLLADPKTSGPAPLLLDVHGGPHNAWSGVADGAHLYHQELAARGWRILTLNPRGSDGYGQEFMRAIVGAWGQADVNDFLEPIDALIAEGLVDPDQLAVTGYSYGGFTTSSLTTRTNRFSAAVAGGLICNFLSLQGTSDLGNFLIDTALGADVRDSPAALLNASPIAKVDQVRTPTLILQGAADERCPLTQAEEWFSALTNKNVTTRMVAYPGGSHLFILNGELSHRLDYNRRVVDWVERYTRTPERPKAISKAPRGAEYWQRRLDTLRVRYGVTGAQFGILELSDLPANGTDGRLNQVVVSSGVANKATGVPVTNDTLFQIGSITKVWTAMLVMQLVDDGLLDLDATVRTYLPDFALLDHHAATRVTVRQLLNHTSGIDGDLFSDMGRGDDCVELYVKSLASAVNIHPLGERFSYCNAGFVVAGRIVEVLRGANWDTVLRERLIEPLGLTHTFSLAEDAPRFSVATGHFGAGAAATPTPTWPLTRSVGPAGIINARMADLLVFAEAAMRGGTLPGGNRVLSEASAARMLDEEIGLRSVLPTATAWGLGWFMEDWDGHLVYGHDGTTLGQNGFLRIFPDHGFAVVLAASGGKTDGLYKELFSDAANAIAGIQASGGIQPGEGSGVAAEHLGFFESGGIHVELGVDEEKPVLRLESKGDLLREGAEPKWDTVPLHTMATAGVYGVSEPGKAGWTQVRPVDGGAYIGYRYVPRKAAQ
ncbi:serine hydrolase [Arthrobacter sp. GMC3]|uniref:serine hydrolase n=1 Tax=Arthrobacter sp. GMC3 TaxID=2058894 RepID=UPI000CE33B36|nr:serine hydrolase [Arthrobacter sp. GMC3]